MLHRSVESLLMYRVDSLLSIVQMIFLSAPREAPSRFGACLVRLAPHLSFPYWFKNVYPRIKCDQRNLSINFFDFNIEDDVEGHAAVPGAKTG